MLKEQLQTMIRYTAATTQHLLDCAANLSDEQYHAPTQYGQHSIHALLFHVLRASTSWRGGMQSGQQPQRIDKDDYPTREHLRALSEQDAAEWLAYIEQQSDEQLAASFELGLRTGGVVKLGRWHILQHIILHAMQHHAEVAAYLTEHGQQPGDIDFIFFEGLPCS